VVPPSLFMKNKIYIFGNSLLEFDNLPIKLIPDLQKAFPHIEFIHQDPNDNLHPENGELVIIDTAEGISEVKVLTDIDQIIDSPKFSMHDLDLGFTLKLMKKIGTLEKVTIFCVPMSGDGKRILEQLCEQIRIAIARNEF
jgi:Ni,Fe-hydrogenase maturation factor